MKILFVNSSITIASRLAPLRSGLIEFCDSQAAEVSPVSAAIATATTLQDFRSQCLVGSLTHSQRTIRHESSISIYSPRIIFSHR
jgi:hypothetical protein